MHRPLVHALGACCAVLVFNVAQSARAADDVERGGYLVKAFGCGECHTPWKMGPTGPAPDESRHLAGHPQDAALPPAPAATGPWISGTSATHTAFWGPWGTSFAANLTPDATGMGAWKVEDFIAAMRTGRHLGVGRRILPPMPSGPTGHLTDADLTAMFAYLRSVRPIVNRVPDPLPPMAGASH